MKDLSFLTKNLIAHRGIHNNKIIENTLDAFKLAIIKNYIIELDVHLLKDKEIVVFHDDNLKRLTGKDIMIKDLTLKQLNQIKLKNNSQIPTLKEVLKVINGKVPVIIELKYDNKVGLLEQELVKILDKYKGDFAVKSFNPLTIRWFKKNRPNYIRGLLLTSKTDTLKKKIAQNSLTLLLSKPDFISCDYKLYKSKIIKKNIPVICWTIKTKANYNKYKNYFDNMICENIDLIKEG